MQQPRGRLSDDDVATIREKVHLPDVVEQSGVHLRRSGATLKGLCPFHAEKTPSFTVSHDHYHCFGCGAGGDVFDYLREKDGLPFRDAVESLAPQAGIVLRVEQDAPEVEARRKTTARALTILAAAQAWFESNLHVDHPSAAAARRILTDRGFTGEDATAHGCGYSPADAAPLLAHLRAECGATAEEVTAAGLVRSNGRPFFSDRLTWPLRDSLGKVTGFSGRELRPPTGKRSGAKFINSPQSPWFDKGRLLYRLKEAVTLARQTGTLYVVEGFTDVMACENVGVAAVASCGTAFTEGHLDLLLKRLGDSTTIAFGFDSDHAGQAAAIKAFHIARDHLERCTAVLLPEGNDPCDLYKALPAHRRPELADTLARTMPLTEAALRITTQSHLSKAATPEAQMKAVSDALALLTGLPDILVNGYRPLIADLAGVNITDLPTHAATTTGHHPTEPPPAAWEPPPPPWDEPAPRVEEHTLPRQKVDPGDWVEVAIWWAAALNPGRSTTAAINMADPSWFTQPEPRRLLGYAQAAVAAQPQQWVQHCVDEIEAMQDTDLLAYLDAIQVDQQIESDAANADMLWSSYRIAGRALKRAKDRATVERAEAGLAGAEPATIADLARHEEALTDTIRETTRRAEEAGYKEGRDVPSGTSPVAPVRR